MTPADALEGIYHRPQRHRSLATSCSPDPWGSRLPCPFPVGRSCGQVRCDSPVRMLSPAAVGCRQTCEHPGNTHRSPWRSAAGGALPSLSLCRHVCDGSRSRKTNQRQCSIWGPGLALQGPAYLCQHLQAWHSRYGNSAPQASWPC